MLLEGKALASGELKVIDRPLGDIIIKSSTGKVSACFTKVELERIRHDEDEGEIPNWILANIEAAEVILNVQGIRETT